MPIVEKRCIVLVGKTGGGKSTIANQLVGQDLLSGRKPPFAVSPKLLGGVTTDILHKDFETVKGDVKYKIKVVDTVGLFGDTHEDNSVIVDKIEEYFKNHITKVSVILFVLKKGRFTKQEEQVFSLLRGRFKKEIQPISALALTGCESDLAESRQTFVDELRSDPRTQEIAGQMDKGILPVGFPPLKTMPPILQQAYKEGIARDRETLLDLVIGADKMELTRKLFEEEVLPKMKEERRWCTIL